MTGNTALDATSDRATRPKIMIVDDEPIVVKVLGLYLKKAGYDDVVSTTDSTAAMDMIRRCCPNLLLLDLSMPGRSGLDILDEIAHDPTLSELRVIVITATCDDGLKAQARRLGAKAVLAKPIEDVDMVWRIREALA